MPSKKKDTLLQNVLQAVVISVALGVLGACWKTYMDVHDMKHSVAAIERRLKMVQGKQDWLFHYDFPDEDKDDGR